MVAATGIVADFSGSFEATEKYFLLAKKHFEAPKDITVSIEGDRKDKGALEEESLDPDNARSDVVTIFADGSPIKTIEIYHTIKNQKFKNYPATENLADFWIPTEAEYLLEDLKEDGSRYTILLLRNKIYSLHPDNLLSVLIFDSDGNLLAKTPYPSDIPGLFSDLTEPYSAYKATGVMRDEITQASDAVFFCNGFSIEERGGKNTFYFHG